MNMAPTQISVMRPSPVKSRFLAPRIRSIAKSGIFSNRGPQVRELESRLAKWLDINASQIVATSNATLALAAAIAVSPAKSWHVPAWSFPATALAPLGLGTRVEFVDIDPATWLTLDKRPEVDVGLIRVIPFGGSFDKEIWSPPGEIVVDAAASLASRPRDLSQLPDSASVIFSLHATKTMGGAEGGIVVFGSQERAERARSWINFGFLGGRESVALGTNGKMSEYDAAVANARLDGWQEESQGWLRVRRASIEMGQALGLAEHPKAMEAIGPYWIGMFGSSTIRNKASKVLEAAHVETRLWWGEGLHKMPAFSDVRTMDLSNTEDVAGRYLGLPTHLYLSQRDFCRMGGLIAEAQGRSKKANSS